MKNAVLFLQNEVADPFARYRALRRRGPVIWDSESALWAVLSYEACTQVLHESRAVVPALGDDVAAGMSPVCRAVAGDLARLANPPDHGLRRRAATMLFEAFDPPETGALLDTLLAPHVGGREVDWVPVVCKKLPALWVLTALGFESADRAALLDSVADLTTILRPGATVEVLERLNAIVPEASRAIERHIRARLGRSVLRPGPEGLSLTVANLIGLLIQSYDAGRGLLANALVRASRAGRRGRLDSRALVRETLRFDPPIHNTRRVARADMVIAGTSITAGQAVLVVLAAANRDPDRFSRPDLFDPARSDAEAHLTFGAGLHGCPAHRWAVEMAAETLDHLFRRHPRVRLLSVGSEVEPIANARLIKSIVVSL